MTLIIERSMSRATGLHGTQRIDIDTALRMTGAGTDELRLAIVDLFKAD